MGRINDVMLGYLNDNTRFADLFNGCCFHGKQIVNADELTEGSAGYLEKKQTAAGGRKIFQLSAIKIFIHTASS